MLDIQIKEQKANTLFDKIWDKHQVVKETFEKPAILYIDSHYIHEVTSPQAFEMLRQKGLKIRHPEKILATTDHSTPTNKVDGEFLFSGKKEKLQVEKLKQNCEAFGITLFELGDENQGIVHVIGPELGFTQPGKTIVCGDSHTSTHGAFGALAFGIGTSEVGYTFATQCLPQRKPKNLGIKVDGKLNKGVTAKDLILAIIAKIGIGGATAHVIEFFGETIRGFNMEQRMTVCNMAIEAGARAGLIAPDKTTFDYLEGRRYSPKGEQWQLAIDKWSKLYTDKNATFDKLLTINASDIQPMITYGTNPEMAVAITQLIPKNTPQAVLDYMGFESQQSMVGKTVDVVFIGSCTNSRISDLRDVAEVFKNKNIASHIRALIVPGSQQIKKQAEVEGLDKIFLKAGAEWREPGCSMCLGMNGDIIQPGQVCVSTSNRNFEGRQGKGGRTLLASPITAAYAAIHGKVVNSKNINNTSFQEAT